jgi:NADH-quinone oxidoreductase chain G
MFLEVLINGVSYTSDKLLTIYQLCFKNEINLPCFCYHDKLSIAGNCRMCLVEVNQGMAVSCAIPIAQDMVILTNTARLRHSRESILEFLLINHPLDCPICDQGGECDLQDITYTFGSDRGRFFGFKRSVDNLNCLGPMIKTVMTRCIHCTRCVRFLQEYGTTPLLGTLGRGSAMEIGTYVDVFDQEELSGNIIDLCPVGALTAMPYAFTYRSWELKSIESIDIFDALASAVRVDIANNRVVRILPATDEDTNEQWISNKARFAHDSLNVERGFYPRYYIGNQSYPISWPKALYLFTKNLLFSTNQNIKVLCGNYLDLTSALLIKKYYNSFGCSNICYENNFYKETDFRFNYLLNDTLDRMETLDFVLFINANPRLEAPVVNSRFRRNYLNNINVKFFSLGNSFSYSAYPILNIGNSTLSLIKFLQGTKANINPIMHTAFLNYNLPKVNSGLILLGSALFDRKDSNEILKSIKDFHQKVGGMNFKYGFLADFLGRLSFYENGLVSKKIFIENKEAKGFYHIFASHSAQPQITKEKLFTVFQGVFENLLPYAINLYLPSRSHLEQSKIYFNMEGRLRFTKAAVTPFRLIHSDEEILTILSLLKKRFLLSNYSSLTNFQATSDFFKNILSYKRHFINLDHSREDLLIEMNSLNINENYSFDSIIPYTVGLNNSYSKLKVINSMFSRKIYNYYSQDVYCKNSKVMSLAAMKLSSLISD